MFRKKLVTQKTAKQVYSFYGTKVLGKSQGKREPLKRCWKFLHRKWPLGSTFPKKSLCWICLHSGLLNLLPTTTKREKSNHESQGKTKSKVRISTRILLRDVMVVLFSGHLFYWMQNFFGSCLMLMDAGHLITASLVYS